MKESLSLLVLFGLFGLLAPAALAAEPLSYNRDVRPLLSDRCFACHGPDSAHREADLRLDIEEVAKEHAIVSGKPDESELIARITSSDPKLMMPPPKSGKSLTPQERDLLLRWIKDGAPYEQPWAYVPPRRFETPAVDSPEWCANWIDNFILARLTREKLHPSPPADRVTLLRRLSFDLTGLPPTPEEVASFLDDPSSDSWERQIDRLLSSERFGERMAMYWLDLVRYADTVGYHGDQEHNISPYRDYVIDAFNANLPFDRFTREQLAGDLLPNATIDQRIATGYNRLLQTSHEGGVQPKEYLAIYAADRVRNLSGVWFGGTIGCAQCHDHKFDPYTMKDFYSLAAFFADVDESQHFKGGADTTPTPRLPELEVLSRRDRETLAELERNLAELQQSKEPAPETATRIEELSRQIEQIKKSARKTMVTVSIPPRTMRILPRGNWLDDSGPIVEPAIPEFFGRLDVGDRRATRLDLADWLTDPVGGAGGLTARVLVNRLWYLMYGVGLSKSLEDFGGQGEAPVHPELLDRLAIEFIDGGWDIKRMLKLIAMSNTYRQSSITTDDLRERDPENRLYARQTAIRIPAEMIRDTALSVSGLLVHQVGGPSIRPYQPAGYYRHLNFPKRDYEADRNQNQWRRGVYVHWQRQFLHPMLKAFDAPSREECTAARPISNTPLAALVLLNDPTFVEAAAHFAARVLTDGGDTDNRRLEHAFRLAVSRSPDDVESRLLLSLLEKSRAGFAADSKPAEALIQSSGKDPQTAAEKAELAAWTQVCRAILNMNETITRN